MEEKFRLELLSMIDRFADDNTVMMIDGCVCRLLRKYDINEKHTELCVLENENEKILNTYRASLRLEGRSPSTIYQYMDSIKHTLDDLGNKNIKDITTNDIRWALSLYQQRVSNTTANNRRKNLSAFFRWLTLEEIIPKNPMLKIHEIKSRYVTKKPFSDEDVEKLLDNCDTIKNREDIDFKSGECTVIGKGNKERTVYISERSMYYIKEYIMTRKDNLEPLFLNDHGTRLSKESIRQRLHKIGDVAKVSNVHPHRCRRTLATELARKGMPIQYVQQILGHAKLDTTMIYCICDKKNVENEFNKVM
jgi:site-specific recombinase XerD